MRRCAACLAALSLGVMVGACSTESGESDESSVAVTAAVTPPATQPSGTPFASCGTDSNPDVAGPVDQARPDRLAARVVPVAAFDQDSGVVVMITAGEDVADATWLFDVCTNTWSQGTPPPVPLLYHGAVVYDIDSDRVLVMPPFDDKSQGVLAYDANTDSWGVGTALPPGDIDAVTGSALYDPVSGLVTAHDRHHFLTYDVDLDEWDEVWIAGFSISNGTAALAYDPAADRIVFWSDPMVTVNLRTGERDEYEVAQPELVYGWPPPPLYYGQNDDGLGIIHTLGSGELWGFDPTSHQWIGVYTADDFDEGPGVAGRRGIDAMVYDPINERLIVTGGMYADAEGWHDIDDTWAIDLDTGSWTLLVPTSRT